MGMWRELVLRLVGVLSGELSGLAVRTTEKEKEGGGGDSEY